jgi:ferredoxin-type protein NapH
VKRGWQSFRKGLIFVSFLFLPITIFFLSPYLIIQGASAGIVTGSFVIFCAQFAASLFMGRSFCGWLCPVGGGQEACAAANPKPVGGRIDTVKYIIFIPWIASIAAFFFLAGGFRSFDFFYQTTNGVSIDEPWKFILYYAIVAIVLGLPLIFGKRFFCHGFCWMAVLMVLGRKISRFLRLPSLRLRAAAPRCVNCGTCEKNCPMSLPVMAMVRKADMENAECVLCGQCAANCPNGTIRFCFNRERKQK